MKKFVTKNKLQIISILIVFICFGNVLAQNNVGIGTTSPDASALLELQSTNSGFLPPRMTTTQRDAIASPATGLYIWNTTIGRYEYNSGTPASPNWVGFLTGSTIPLNNQYIFVGNASNYATGVQLTGDATITNAGVLTIANNAITTTKILNDAVDGTKINLSGNLNGDLMYYNGTDWVSLPVGTINQVLTSTGTIPAWQTSSSSIPTGTLDQTLRNNGTNWVVNTTLSANATGKLTLGDAATNAGSAVFYDGNGGQKLILQSVDLSADRTYTFPDVGANAYIILSEGSQTLNGAITFSDNIALQPNTSGTAKKLKFYEDNANGTNNISITAPSALSTDYTLTLPPNAGSLNQVLTTDGLGVLSWASPSGGLPSGTDKQTLRYNGTTLTATSNLINDGTNIGIGTSLTTPASQLHIDAGTNTSSYLKFTAGTTTGQASGNGFDVGIDGLGYAQLFQRGNFGMIFYTNNIERMRIFNGTKTNIGINQQTLVDDSYKLYIGNNDGFRGMLYVDSSIVTGAEIKLFDNSGSNKFVAFKAPNTVTTNATYTLPAADGTSGQVLKTDGAGTLSWGTPRLNVVTTNTAYSMSSTDDVVIVTASSTVTITLPTAVGYSGKVIYIKRTSTNAAVTIFVAGYGGTENIDGATQQSLINTTKRAFILISDGTGWYSFSASGL